MGRIPSGVSATRASSRRCLAGFLFLPGLVVLGYPAEAPTLPPAFAAPVIIRSSSAAPRQGPLHVLTWNIDRGTHYTQLLGSLQHLEPDLLLLQEVDSGTARTGGKDIARDLASALGLHAVFGIEFQELSQEQGAAAYTGQATLSRLPVRAARILRFAHQSGFWQPRPWIPRSIPLLQRRLGNRIALVTELDLAGKLLVVYNLHLESRSYGRIQFQQLDEVLADCLARYPPATAVLLGGDLNSKYLPGRYLKKLQQAGFTSATGQQTPRTHTIAMALDWLFARNLPAWQNGSVDHTATGSDHYPVTARLPTAK